jgi:hypothetical protein
VILNRFTVYIVWSILWSLLPPFYPREAEARGEINFLYVTELKELYEITFAPSFKKNLFKRLLLQDAVRQNTASSLASLILRLS